MAFEEVEVKNRVLFRGSNSYDIVHLTAISILIRFFVTSKQAIFTRQTFHATVFTFMLGTFTVTPACVIAKDHTDKVTIVKLDSVKGAHVTTRTTWRLVWKHQGTWFVFYGRGGGSKGTYRTSKNGRIWCSHRE